MADLQFPYFIFESDSQHEANPMMVASLYISDYSVRIPPDIPLKCCKANPIKTSLGRLGSSYLSPNHLMAGFFLRMTDCTNVIL